MPGWALARVVVVLALIATRLYLRLTHEADPTVLLRSRQGLMSWDADWYRGIALHGYAGVAREGLRFFPLYPLTARSLAAPFGSGAATTVALLVMANGLALVLGGLIHRLVLVETDDPTLARRAAWLTAVAPPAFVLVMGYSEPMAISLAVAALWALRRRRWWWAAIAGLLYGLSRPVGILLAVPALLEAARDLRAAPRREWLGRAAAVAAAPAGGAVYLAWVWARFGHPLLPYQVQSSGHLRGGLADPLAVLAHAVIRLVQGDLGAQVHYPWVIALVGLGVLCARRWPPSYAAFVAVTLLAVMASYNLNSLERYLLGAFPIVLTGAGLVRSRRAEVLAVAVSLALLGVYTAAALSSQYVP